MAIDKISFLQQSPLIQQQGGAAAIQPIKSPFESTQGTDPVFTEAIGKFAQKANPFSAQTNPIDSKFNEGLAPLKQGALGEDALYTKGGRLGKELNFFA